MLQVSYGLGILIRTYTREQFLDSVPWLLGSLGVVSLDVLISLQVCGTWWPVLAGSTAPQCLSEIPAAMT